MKSHVWENDEVEKAVCKEKYIYTVRECANNEDKKKCNVYIDEKNVLMREKNS